MLLTLVTVENFKKVRDITISPAADRHLILLGGNNAQGKSSTMDAITMALEGGKVAPDTVRRGAKEARIYLEYDGGKLSVERVISDGKTHVSVRNEHGPVRSPQGMLDGLIAARFLDPLAFLRLPAKDQRAALMKVIPAAARLEELELKRKGAFDRRTEIGREIDKAKGAFASLPEPTDPGPAIEVAKLSSESNQLVQEREGIHAAIRRSEDAIAAVATAKKLRAFQVAEVDRLDAEIRRLMKLHEEASAELPKHDAKITAAESACVEAGKVVDATKDREVSIAARLGQISIELLRADAHNRAVHETETLGKRRSEASAAIEKLEADSKACTALLATIDARKVEVLSKSPLPVPGLAVEEDGITLNGVAFGQASGAEKMRVALAIAIAASPQLDDVWVKDAAILDDESLAEIERQMRGTGKRAWLEIVGKRTADTIEIRDGAVVS